jgi:hypothetical protein
MIDSTRRGLLRGGAVVMAVAGLPLVATACSETAVTLPLDPAAMATLAAIVERIIPTDSVSPGAREAGCAAYIARWLNETRDIEARTLWTKGLAATDVMAHDNGGKSFARLAPDQQDAILKVWAKNEAKPETLGEMFFVALKEVTIFAYYSSEIGIRRDQDYRGNQVLEAFVGTDIATLPSFQELLAMSKGRTL